jgi:hypothetical protein
MHRKFGWNKGYNECQLVYEEKYSVTVDLDSCFKLTVDLDSCFKLTVDLDSCFKLTVKDPAIG